MFRLQCLLAVASNHDNTEEAADHRAAEKQEDDWDSNGPDARREEVLNGVRIVDEGLDRMSEKKQLSNVQMHVRFTIKSVQTV